MKIFRLGIKWTAPLMIIALILAASSIAYGLTRATTDLPASFVSVEATYGLTVIDSDGNLLSGLEFGEVVQGAGGRAAFSIRNDGNTGVRLGFRVSTGPGDDQVFVPASRCAVSVPGGPSELREIEGAMQELRRVHEAVHQELDPLDSLEAEERHRQFHHEMEAELEMLQAKADEIRISPQRGVGQVIEVPGVASLCFVVGGNDSRVGEIIPPGGATSVMVQLHSDPDVSLGIQEFTILADAHDLDEPSIPPTDVDVEGSQG